MLKLVDINDEALYMDYRRIRDIATKLNTEPALRGNGKERKIHLTIELKLNNYDIVDQGDLIQVFKGKSEGFFSLRILNIEIAGV